MRVNICIRFNDGDTPVKSCGEITHYEIRQLVEEPLRNDALKQLVLDWIGDSNRWSIVRGSQVIHDNLNKNLPTVTIDMINHVIEAPSTLIDDESTEILELRGWNVLRR